MPRTCGGSRAFLLEAGLRVSFPVWPVQSDGNTSTEQCIPFRLLMLQADPTLRAHLWGRGQCTPTWWLTRTREALVPCRAGQSRQLHLQRLRMPQSSGQSYCRGWPSPLSQGQRLEAWALGRNSARGSHGLAGRPHLLLQSSGPQTDKARAPGELVPASLQ